MPLAAYYLLNGSKLGSGDLKQCFTSRQAKNKRCIKNISTTTFADISRSFMDPFHEFFRSHMSPRSLTHVLLVINRYNTSLAFLLHEHWTYVSSTSKTSVADPWHFGVDPDLDPRILASDWWIRIRGCMHSPFFWRRNPTKTLGFLLPWISPWIFVGFLLSFPPYARPF